MQGLHEPEGAQTVYLRVSLGGEPTLAVVVLLALGGQFAEPPGEEERRAHGAPITEADLMARRRPWYAWLVLPALVLALPVLAAQLAVWFCRVLISGPSRVRAAYRHREAADWRPPS